MTNLSAAYHTIDSEANGKAPRAAACLRAPEVKAARDPLTQIEFAESVSPAPEHPAIVPSDRALPWRLTLGKVRAIVTATASRNSALVVVLARALLLELRAGHVEVRSGAEVVIFPGSGNAAAVTQIEWELRAACQAARLWDAVVAETLHAGRARTAIDDPVELDSVFARAA